MIPCLICGRTVQGGWIIGFPPAPDSQKIGLCSEHDTPENRAQAEKQWNRMVAEQLQVASQIEQQRAGMQTWEATVYFKAGGIATYPCSSCKATDYGALHLITVQGEHLFVPLKDIKEYFLKKNAAGGSRV